MAESGKFTSDTGRVGAAQDSMEGLSTLVFDWFNRFVGDLSEAPEVLKWDEFGRSAGQQLQQMTSQLSDAGMSLSKVLGAIPLAFQAQQAYLQKTQQGVVDTLGQAGSKQSQALPETGGKPGKY
ncbi:MAG: hypothetical protein JWP48_2352 [Actinoallomurus sp.]|jgi:hypothetical protein|nr:hypothetical protein [Actinoallomurus sp.]